MRTTKTFLALLATLVLASAGVSAQSFLTNGLVAYYPFNGTAADKSGLGKNGTNYGGTYSTNQFGLTNASIFLNNVSSLNLPETDADRVGVPINTLNNLTSGTISVWVRPNDVSRGAFFSKQDPGVGSFAVFSVGGYASGGGPPSSGTPGTLYFHSQNGTTIGQSTRTIVTGQWQQVCVTFTPSNCLFYINGAYAGGTTNSNFSVPANLDGGITASIGAFVGGVYDPGNPIPQEWIYGSLDYFRIYNLALSSNQVAQLYSYESKPPAPVIITDLTNALAVVGSNYTLSGLAVSQSAVSYQWFFTNGTVQGLAGAYAQTVSGFVYGAVVTNGGFGYGNNPNVHFVGGGGTGAAGYGTVSNGSLVSITVTNAGGGYTSLPAVVIDPPDGYLLGQTNNTLVLDDVETNAVGDYWFVASNTNGSVTSSVVALTLVYPPSITTQPSLAETPLHGSANFNVVATGTAPLQYQWSFGGANLSGATNSVLALQNINTNQAGYYAVTVSNPYGQETSSAAQLAISPSITVAFTGVVGLWGQPATLSVGAIGTGILEYQWLQNGVAISGATNSTLMFDTIQFTNAGLYSVVVSSSFGSVTNAAYQVIVNPANTIIGLYPGITITGTVGYTYQIQSSTNLSNLNGWLTETNITLTQPVENWYDGNANTTQSSNPHKFYQVLPGP